MNKRIHKLAEDSGMTEYVAANNKYLERFAELIIRECIKAAGDPGDGLIKNNTWHDGVRASIWSIQQEFGLDRNFGIES